MITSSRRLCLMLALMISLALIPAAGATPAAEQFRLEVAVCRINPWLAAPAATVRLWLPESQNWRVTSPTKKDR